MCSPVCEFSAIVSPAPITDTLPCMLLASDLNGASPALPLRPNPYCAKASRCWLTAQSYRRTNAGMSYLFDSPYGAACAPLCLQAAPQSVRSMMVKQNLYHIPRTQPLTSSSSVSGGFTTTNVIHGDGSLFTMRCLHPTPCLPDQSWR